MTRSKALSIDNKPDIIPAMKRSEISARAMKRKEEMLAYRRPPFCWTGQQIADHFHVKRQRVFQIIGRTVRGEEVKPAKKS
jgi:hypothetical protein